MSGWFVVTLIVAAIAVIAWLAAFFGSSREAGLFGGVATVVAIVCLILSCNTTIGAKSVGVTVSFGKVSDKVLKPGLNGHKPWVSVEEFSGALKPVNLSENTKEDGCQGVTVRLAIGTTACADVSLQYNIDSAGDVPELYRDYQNEERIETDLVVRQLRNSLNHQFERFDPLAALKAGEATGSATAKTPAAKPATPANPRQPTAAELEAMPGLGGIAARAKADLQAAIGTGVKIHNLLIPLVHYDAETESRLRTYQQALADTRIAEQQKLTNEKTRLANEELVKSRAGQDEGVQFQNCLNLIRELAGKNMLGQLPPTFSCPGTGTGAQALVNVPAR